MWIDSVCKDERNLILKTFFETIPFISHFLQGWVANTIDWYNKNIEISINTLGWDKKKRLHFSDISIPGRDQISMYWVNFSILALDRKKKFPKFSHVGTRKKLFFWYMYYFSDTWIPNQDWKSLGSMYLFIWDWDEENYFSIFWSCIGSKI